MGYRESDFSLGLSENFFNLCFNKIPSAEIIKAFNVSLILYAEHGFNCSTFTSRVITSAQADLYGAVTGAIAALKGPLHGGANEKVMHMMKEIGEPSNAKNWLLSKLENKEKVMGFGHRVYYKGDSRVPVMKKYTELLSEEKEERKWMEIYNVLEETMVGEKNIFPNLDFPAGPAYYLMGFDIDMFTPIFVMARITGWSAHIIEQTENNRIIRPLCQYIGEKNRAIKPINER
jgi:2-methylcitrate synthase